MRWLRHPFLCLIAFSATAMPLAAQRSGTPITPPNAQPGIPRVGEPLPGETQSPADSLNTLLNFETMSVGSPMDAITQEDCGAWTQTGSRSATVSITRLQVSGKARSEYQKVCSEFKKKKLTDAERDAQKVVGQFPKYPAAWVLLGEALFYEQQLDRAHTACAQASEVDPGYVSPYLCLAAIADTQQDWDQTDDMSDKALAVNPLQNPYALYYKADVAFHQERYKDAQEIAQSAADADTTHQMPEIQLLLARIYRALNQQSAEEAQVRDYLKFQHQPSDPNAVHAQMANLEAQETPK